MSIRHTLFSTSILAGLALTAVTPATAQEAQNQKLPMYQDQDYITVQGEVLETSGDEFTLDYDDNQITVEMDDWDLFLNEAEALIPGERVTVSGFIDDDFLEGREIEARTVFVEERQSFFYDEDISDDEISYLVYNQIAPVVESNWMSVTGYVKTITGRQFTLDTGRRDFVVDTSLLPENPLDDIGMQQVDVGDQVHVTGGLNNSFFETGEIQASSLISMYRDEKSETSSN